MTEAIIAFAALVGAVVFKLISSNSDKKSGAIRQQRDHAEGRLGDVRKAKDARDRLNFDGEYSDRVRDRFTRKE